MLRLGKIYNQPWEKILTEAANYSIHSEHPAKILVSPNKLVYWHIDGLFLGFWHAELDRDPDTHEVTLTRGDDERARSEIESYRFLDTLLKITNKRVQGA
jgi:hypothetical protein